MADTPFDFRQMHAIGARIRGDDDQLRRGRGYDHNYCLPEGEGVRLAARVESQASGRVMELHTNQPGLQFGVQPGLQCTPFEVVTASDGGSQSVFDNGAPVDPTAWISGRFCVITM